MTSLSVESRPMAGGGGGDGKTWIGLLVGGGVLVGVAMGAESAGMELGSWLTAGLLGIGGLLVVFGSCEAMIKGVEGAAARLDMNEFVAGTMAGLASNIPELVMLGFVLAAAPRVGFIVTLLTLHVGAAAFGIYSGLLPRDATGHAKLPAPLVKLSTDLYACAAGVFFVMGAIMILMNVFEAGDHRGEALGPYDLYVLGGALLAVQVISVVRLVKRFSSADELPSEERDDDDDASPSAAPWATRTRPRRSPRWCRRVGASLASTACSASARASSAATRSASSRTSSSAV
jgi:hypothetical protein